MNNLRHQKAALAQGNANLADERKKVVGNIKAQTNKMLHAFRRERMAMAKTLKSELAADRMNRSAEVLSIRDNAIKMGTGFLQDHALMRHGLRQRLLESREDVMTSVASLLVDFSEDRAAFSKAHDLMTKAQCEALTKDRRNRSRGVAELMRSFTKAHRHMAKTQRAGLVKERRDRSRAVVELMRHFRTSRGVMAQELAANLKTSRQETIASISGLRWSGAVCEFVDLHRQMDTRLAAEPSVEEPTVPMSVLGREPEQVVSAERPKKPATGEMDHPSAKPWKSKKK